MPNDFLDPLTGQALNQPIDMQLEDLRNALASQLGQQGGIAQPSQITPQAEPQLEDILRRNMGLGIAIDPSRIAPTNPGGLAYQGPVAGYAGPLRPGDVPSDQAGAEIPVYHGAQLSPGTQQAQQRQAQQQVSQMPGDMGQLAQAVQNMTQAGIPPAVIQELLKLSPQAAAQKAAKPVTPAVFSKMAKFNPETRTFDPPTPDLAEADPTTLMKQGYRMYTDKQISSVDEIKDAEVAFQQLKSAIGDIKGKTTPELFLSQHTGGYVGGPEGAVFRKAVTNFTTIFDKFLGGVRGAASPQMQAIRSQVLPGIMSSPEVSNRLMSDLEDLLKAMSDTRLKSVLGGQATNTAQLNKQAAKVLDAYQKSGGAVSGAAAGAMGAAAGATGANQLPQGLPQGAKPTGRTSGGKPVYALPNGKLWVE